MSEWMFCLYKICTLNSDGGGDGHDDDGDDGDEDDLKQMCEYACVCVFSCAIPLKSKRFSFWCQINYD